MAVGETCACCGAAVVAVAVVVVLAVWWWRCGGGCVAVAVVVAARTVSAVLKRCAFLRGAAQIRACVARQPRPLARVVPNKLTSATHPISIDLVSAVYLLKLETEEEGAAI